MTDDSWREIRPIAVGVATRGDEIWFLYAVAFEESWPYERDALTGVEDDSEPFRVVWKERSALADETVYPAELPDLIDRQTGPS